MNAPEMPSNPDAPRAEPPGAAESNENETGLPGLRNWSAVYVLVMGSFVLWVVLLFTLGALFR